jgi:hypothetical protein
MSLRLALVILLAIAVFSGVGFWIVVTNVDPERAGALGLTLFFTTLFFGLAATFTLIGTFVRVALNRQLAPVRHLGVALRQGVLLTTLFSLALLLQGQQYLRWWNAAALILFIATIEFFFLMSTPPPYRR